MSDNKRVLLTTLEPQKSSEKGGKKYSKTVRVYVSVPESNEDTCPIFHYKDELAAAKKKPKENAKEPLETLSNGLDPFDEDNDDDVRRIALEMEAKYGSGMMGGAKKKHKGRKDDYADIGAGYDENDSFIDNTDGYDEMIPHNVTTALGGFYINSGALEFKTDDEATSGVSSESSGSEDSSESEEEEGNKRIKRKRVLESSEEEGVGGGGNSNQSAEGQKNQNGEKPSISMQLAIKQKLFSPEKIQIKKRKLASQQKSTVKELLREKRQDPVNGADPTKDISKENKKPMRLSSVVAAIDSVIARNDDLREENGTADVNTNSNKLSLPVEILEPGKPQEVVKLPENLPADIQDIIENLKKASREHKDGGKVKFFSGNVNTLLLNLERKCKVLGRSSRAKVYEHLAPFVRCRKETLVKRARSLVQEDENRRLQRTIGSLKSQIIRLMPALIANHEKECQRILEKKFSQEAANNDELKNLKAPRRRFPLHEEMKRMIRDVVNFKKRCFLHEGRSKNELEDLLTDYLKKQVLTLWPEGWMSMAVLGKFCSSLAIKTPDPKSAVIKQHSQKLPPSSTIVNSNVTFTPINLTEKLGSCSVAKSEPHDVIIESPERVEKQSSYNKKDNGVIVLSSKSKEPVISQVIDLTEMPVKKSVIENSKFEPFPKKSDIQEDVQRTIESLLALQKRSEPKSEASNSGTSVITYSKSYNQGCDRTDIWNPNEFQKQLAATHTAAEISKFNNSYKKQ
ncbi:ubinuclein-1 isoform X1 [Euwallacea fornicatus]|uniref:ubinuclein-1 isoform X1 n=1 Tax=Euwallacea fornicatus TaxID=995702 RepID=UPI0033904B15